MYLFTDKPRETDVVQHRIKLTVDALIRCKLYTLLYAMWEELRNVVDSMLEMGVAKPYALPIVMVKKKVLIGCVLTSKC